MGFENFKLKTYDHRLSNFLFDIIFEALKNEIPSRIYIPMASTIESASARRWLMRREGSEIELKGEIHHRSWVQEMKKYQDQVVIQQNGEYDKIPADVPGFHTIKLTPYQQSTVCTMLTLERKRWINLRCKRGEVALYYSAGRVSEMVGAGKTIEILALICKQRYPTIAPDIRSFNTIKRHERYIGRANFVKVRYAPRNILKPTLIVVGPSVVEQWLDAIHTFTDLTCLAVHSKSDFENLMEAVHNGSVNQYDIVLVKNGHVGVGFHWIDDIKVMKKNRIKNPWTLNVLSNYTRKTWSRVVLDDADTLGMPYNVTPIPSIFMWIISSTNNSKQKTHGHNHQYNRASELMACHPYGYWRILHNQSINALLNVTSSDSFIMHANGLAAPIISVVRFANTHDQIIDLLGSLDDDTAREVQEMLNNDAFKDAAKKIGIESHSVADIFQSLLGDKYKKYKKAEEILAFLDTIPEDSKFRLPIKKNPDKDDKLFTKGRLLKFEQPKYNYPNLKSLIEETRATYKQVYEECGKAVERVKDNIKHGLCPICRTNLAVKNVEVFILKCCDSVYCAGCAIDILGLAKTGQPLKSLCRKCRLSIKITDMIYVGTDIDKLDIADKYALVLAEEPVKVEVKESEDDEAEYTKARAIVDICTGEPIRNDIEHVTMEIPKLMKGFATNLPLPVYRKVLVYVFMPSACAEVEKGLDKYEVKYWRLGGDVRNLSRIARKFNKYEGNCALLIQSEKHYAGLNLQTATHAVLYGVPHNVSILTQFLGRGQRIGRTTQLQIVFMVYKNEYKLLEHRFDMQRA